MTMLNWDIPININVAAHTEKEAEEIVSKILNQEMKKPALERNMNGWDFIIFTEDEDPFN